MQDAVSSLLNHSVGAIKMSNLLSAAVTALICLAVIRVLLKLSRRLLSTTKLDERVQHYIAAGIRLLLYIVGTLIVVDSLGIPSTSLVALLSVGSLGITLAAEDILGNVAGGLVILSSHPFQTGDIIEVSGTCGTVEEISLNHTRLTTIDGLRVMLPNQELASSQIINYSSLGRRRIALKVTASYDAPTAAVRSACEQAFAMTARILPDPAPSVVLSNYGASSIEYTLLCWVDPTDYWTVYYALNEHLRDTFAQRKVEMTYDHLNVHIVETQG